MGTRNGAVTHKKRAKQPKKRVFMCTSTQKRQQIHGFDVIGSFITFASILRGLVTVLPKVRKSNAGFDTIRQRKCLLLLHLWAIETQSGKFSHADIRHFYRSSNVKWAIEHWERLISEGWIIELPKLRKSRYAITSPLFASLRSSLITHLRRIGEESMQIMIEESTVPGSIVPDPVFEDIKDNR